MVHEPLSHAGQGALQGMLEHQGPAKGTPTQGMGQTTACVEMVAAARAEQAPRESLWGGEKRASAPHLAALAGHGWVGGTQDTAASSSEALAAPPCQHLIAKGSSQR